MAPKTNERDVKGRKTDVSSQGRCVHGPSPPRPLHREEVGANLHWEALQIPGTKSRRETSSVTKQLITLKETAEF